MKIKSIVLTIILALVLSSCRYSAPGPRPMPTATPMAVIHSASSNDVDELTAFDMIDSDSFDMPITLVDEDDITAVLKTIEAADADNIEMVFEVNNKTEYLYYFNLNHLCFNSYMLPEYGEGFEIISMTTDEYRVTIDYETLSSIYSINEIADISFYYIITSLDQAQPQRYLEILSMSNGANYDIKDLTTEYQIAGDEYLDIYFVDAYINEDNRDYFEVLFYNKSDMILNVNSPIFAINGVSFNAAIDTIIMPHSYYLHRDLIFSYENSVLKDIGKAASIEVAVTGRTSISPDILSSIHAKLMIDETIQTETITDKGQVIYNENDMLLSIIDVQTKDTQAFILYAENNSPDIAYLEITGMETDGQTFETYYMFGMLPGTYTVELYDIPLSKQIDGQEITMYCNVYNELGGQTQSQSITFTLK